jgi:hypothetical protein
MSEPDKITAAFDAYVEAFRKGDGDPTPFLKLFTGENRRELEILVDAFLETGPKADFDPDAPLDPEVEMITASVMERFDGATGALSELVRGLRAKLGLGQFEVVRELAISLDASPAEQEKIDGYYHDLEWGTLPSSGISSKVFDALARILKTNPAALREAAKGLGPGRAPSAGMAFARTVVEVDFAQESPAMDVPSGNFRASDPPDRIDELFTGG